VPIAAASVAERIPAWLTIDDLEGRREHGVIDNPTLVGRGGLGCYVHVRLRTEGQVSKEHCRIRRDEQSGDFFIKDLSRNGTSVNGVRLPPGVEYSGSAKREIPGAEVPLLDGARISLADVLSLEFRRA
jgi:pSer/pThr/pTyr-binding forkhead associated (FHA) protein